MAQTLAWASSYYLPALLAAPMAHDLGVAPTTVFAAFSAAMLLAAAVGPAAGRAIDQRGGRPVLIASNLVFAAGLGGLALAQGPWTLFAAWLLIGAAMGGGLYEAGFATLVRLWGHGARSGITGITLIAGFASTVGWPLSAWLEAEYGWRAACGAWALLHLGLGLPLNASLPAAPPMPSTPAPPAPAPAPGQGCASPAPDRLAGEPSPSPSPSQPQSASHQGADFADPPPLTHPLRAGILLSFVFAATWFVSTAMASHLPAVLQLAGAGAAAAVAVGALIGPAQVAGRLMEAGWLRRLHPLLSARLAALGHPVGVLVLASAGPAAAPAFAILHGLGNGIMTIAKGTLPLAIFGPRGYGQLQGLLMAPTRLAQAASPLVFGAALQGWGFGAMLLSSGLCLLAFGALIVLPRAAGVGLGHAGSARN